MPAPSPCRRSCLISGADWVVHHGPQHEFFANLASPAKERHVLPGFFHDTLGERDRAKAVTLARRFPAPPVRSAGSSARPQTGRPLWLHTRRGRPACRAARPAFAERHLLGAEPRLNPHGRLGFERHRTPASSTGFDSGSTLDYVYENKPRGLGPLGKAVDKIFLEAIGWRGIRQRKVHLEELIGEAASELKAAGTPVHLARHRRRPRPLRARRHRQVSTSSLPSVRLQDYSDINVERGRKLIAEREPAGHVSPSTRPTPSTATRCGDRAGADARRSSPASTSCFPTMR